MVYLLTKLGNNREALRLIINRQEDVKMAIEFASNQNDSALWEEFLTTAMDKPDFITGLLALGNFIAPLLIIQRIPVHLTIPGLKSSLINVLSECNSNV